MKVRELLQELERATADNPELAEAEVTWAEDRTPVLGGLFGHVDDKRELNLAPLKLDRIGGF
jgi:hypothetical protein